MNDETTIQANDKDIVRVKVETTITTSTDPAASAEVISIDEHGTLIDDQMEVCAKDETCYEAWMVWKTIYNLSREFEKLCEESKQCVSDGKVIERDFWALLARVKMFGEPLDGLEGRADALLNMVMENSPAYCGE